MNRTSLARPLAVAIFAVAFTVLASASARAQAPAPNLDVTGIKLGMPVKAAVALMKANNPRLNIQQQTLQLEGFDQVIPISVEARTSSEAGQDSESFSLGITMTPSPQVVWGVSRTYTYATQNFPSLDNTIAALRKKYGPESIPPDPDSRAGTKSMVWVFDPQGRLMAPGPAHSLYMTCSAPLSNVFSSTGIINELHGVRVPAECDSVILVSVSLQSSANAVPGSVVIGNLIVQVANGSAFRASMEATRKVFMAAVNAREQKQKDEINKRGAPKI